MMSLSLSLCLSVTLLLLQRFSLVLSSFFRGAVMTVRLWSFPPGSIYKTASCSGPDSLSAGKRTWKHTHTHKPPTAGHNRTLREARCILGRLFYLFLAALPWRLGVRKWDFASGLARGQQREEDLFFGSVSTDGNPSRCVGLARLRKKRSHRSGHSRVLVLGRSRSRFRGVSQSVCGWIILSLFLLFLYSERI